jgi:hypothetical protein
MVDATARSMNDGRQTSSNHVAARPFEMTLLGQASLPGRSRGFVLGITALAIST